MVHYRDDSLAYRELCKHVISIYKQRSAFLSSSLSLSLCVRLTLTAEEKHLVEKHENDFDELIAGVTFTSSSSRDGGDYRERVFREEFLSGWEARDDCAVVVYGGTGREKKGHARAEVNLKTRGAEHVTRTTGSVVGIGVS